MKNVSDAPYTNTDDEYRQICDFLDTLSTLDPCMHWESGRMNYWRYTVHAGKDPQDSFFRDNVHVWRAQDVGILALCISEYGDTDMFVEVLPGHFDVWTDIFRWLEGAWAAKRSAIDIDVFRDDAHKIRRLEAHGFTFLRHFENKRTYDLAQVDLAYTLEDGFTVRTFSDTLDYAGRVALVQSAFDNPAYTEDRIKGLMASPDYVDGYNLSVVSPDGRQVACCVGWHDRAKAGCGYVEPVGTHADFRRRGFAVAVIKECMSRMVANGVHTVEIASRAEPDVSNYLYDSLNPQSKREVHTYRKDIPEIEW